MAQRADIFPQCLADRAKEGEDRARGRDKVAGPDFSGMPFLGFLGFRTSCLLAFTWL